MKRRQADGTQTDIPFPPYLPDYQKYMLGIDRRDQFESYHNIDRKSRKGWRQFFPFV